MHVYGEPDGNNPCISFSIVRVLVASAMVRGRVTFSDDDDDDDGDGGVTPHTQALSW